jgi:hypothetical protein
VHWQLGQKQLLSIDMQEMRVKFALSEERIQHFAVWWWED